MMQTKRENPTLFNVKQIGLRCRLELLCALCPKKYSDGSWRPGPVAMRMTFHEDPDKIESPTLGPLLTAQQHLKDPLDPSMKYTCCFIAEQSGTLDTHDCDRHYIYFVRRVVTNRYIEYMKSGAVEVRSEHGGGAGGGHNRNRYRIPWGVPLT